MRSCSVKWKQGPQDQFIKGARRGPNARPPHPVWIEARRRGQRIVKLIGYDCGAADVRRSKRLQVADDDFDSVHPLQLIGWHRGDCVRAIVQALGAGMVPVKSACFFCPASKAWELFWLAAYHPELVDKALLLERRALTGRHSRFKAIEFGATWEHLVRTADRFPSTSTSVGLGRSFAWCQWARVNGAVDEDCRVRRWRPSAPASRRWRRPGRTTATRSTRVPLAWSASRRCPGKGLRTGVEAGPACRGFPKNPPGRTIRLGPPTPRRCAP